MPSVVLAFKDLTCVGVCVCVSNREDVERRFEGKLSKHMSGSLYEMVSRVMKALVNRKITVPGNFQGYVSNLAIKIFFK